MTEPSLRSVLRELLRGKDGHRAFMNAALSKWNDHVEGLVLDLASGPSESGYRRVLDRGSTDWVRFDVAPASLPNAIVDVDSRLPFKDGVGNVVILANFLYISQDPQQVISETHRVLRRGGRLILTAPLVFNFLPEPKDHWRFTEEGLSLMLARAGFTRWEIVPLGGRWTSAAVALKPYLRPRRVVGSFVFIVCALLDLLATRYGPGRLAPLPVGYCALAIA